MNLEDLKRIRDLRLKEINGRFAFDGSRHIMVCASVGCNSAAKEELVKEFKKQIKQQNLTNVFVEKTGCLGLCSYGPVVLMLPEGTLYSKVDASKVQTIVQQHIIEGKVATSCLVNPNKPEMQTMKDMEFYKNQTLIARFRSEFINPEKIEDYIALGGYSALQKALFNLTQKQIIDEVKASGLKGRGGAGFPTGLKWEITAKNAGDEKYVVCNADEGDPGAFMDRTIIEGDPHRLIEAMIIAGKAINAKSGFVYLRAEYPLAGERLNHAIEQAKEKGLLGKNILGSGFDFVLNIKYGAGAFVCGEETALMHSLEGKRGEPRTRPPYPAESGVFKKPTLLNNVETYANIPEIINKGGAWFAKFGSDGSAGTKVFSLSGKVKNTGLVELEMGSTLRKLIFDVGGGIPNGKKFKAVQIGGPSGACLPESMLDLPITYKSLTENGAMMGSGGIIVLDEDSNMVEVAKFFLEFSEDESCGKCTPCRIGNTRLRELLGILLSGKGTHKDLEELEELAHFIKENSLCGLGQNSPNPVLSTLKYFKQEYINLVENKNAGKYQIIKENCIGCSACANVCPTKCISGEIKKPFEINLEDCIKCGSCEKACKFNAVKKL